MYNYILFSMNETVIRLKYATKQSTLKEIFFINKLHELILGPKRL